MVQWQFGILLALVWRRACGMQADSEAQQHPARVIETRTTGGNGPTNSNRSIRLLMWCVDCVVVACPGQYAATRTERGSVYAHRADRALEPGADLPTGEDVS